MIKLETLRGRGHAISSSEENYWARLEKIYQELQHPSQFKGRLAELRSLQRMRSDDSFSPFHSSENFDSDAIEACYQYLNQQTDALSHLTSIINSNLQALNKMNQEYMKINK